MLLSMGGKELDMSEGLKNSKKRPPGALLSSSSPCESAVSAATCQLGSKLSPEPHPAGVLISGFQPPRL